VTVGGGRVVSTTHAALAVFLPLALRGGLGGLEHAGAGGGEVGVDPNALIGAVGVLNGDASAAVASRAFLLLLLLSCGG
jgi:hypothetical protein